MVCLLVNCALFPAGGGHQLVKCHPWWPHPAGLLLSNLPTHFYSFSNCTPKDSLWGLLQVVCSNRHLHVIAFGRISNLSDLSCYFLKIFMFKRTAAVSLWSVRFSSVCWMKSRTNTSNTSGPLTQCFSFMYQTLTSCKLERWLLVCYLFHEEHTYSIQRNLLFKTWLNTLLLIVAGFS